MNNRFRAAQVIADKILVSLFNKSSHSPQSLGDDIADTLDESGLLAPELPEPAQSFNDGTKGWFVEDDEGRDIGSIYIFSGEILLRTAAGRVKGAPEKMRKIALALLAAANHAEETA